MPEYLLAIGMFVFGVPTLAFEELEQRASWRWADGERYGARAAAQFLGPGEETITLNGTLVPEIAGSFSDIERLKEMAASGEVWPVVMASGRMLGEFRIDAIDTRGQNIIGGGLARRTDFAIDLTRVDDEA